MLDSPLGHSGDSPTREELLSFVSEATGHAGSFSAQMGGKMPWTGARKARTDRLFEWGKRLLKDAGMEGRYE